MLRATPIQHDMGKKKTTSTWPPLQVSLRSETDVFTPLPATSTSETACIFIRTDGLIRESLVILQINVEGLTIAKLDVLEQIAIKNKATVVLLQETHKENNATLKLPGFTLAGHTKSKHHGLATFIQDGAACPGHQLVTQTPPK